MNNKQNGFRTVGALILVCVFAAHAGALEEKGAAMSVERRAELHEEARKLLADRDLSAAVRVYSVLIEHDKGDTTALYNMACACSLLGRRAQAVEFLEWAVHAGYADFHHMGRDPDLAALRDLPDFKALLAEGSDHLKKSQILRIRQLRERFGDRYIFQEDREWRFLLVTNVGEAIRERLLHALRVYSKALGKDFFIHRSEVTLIILVPATARDYAKDFGGRSGAAGFYNHGTRTLTVNLATGTGTMIHEFTHALHYADMEGLKQRHPAWIVEGFGSLYEQCRILPDGRAVGLTNWRLTRNLQPGLKGDQKYLSWKKVTDPKSGVFRRKETISMAYAVTRYIFYYMQEKGVLRNFYKAYRTRFKEDPTGVKFLKEMLGDSVENLEKDWKPWVEKLRYGRTAPRPRVRLGVHLEQADAGLTVRSVVKGSAAEKAGVIQGDLILSAGGKRIKDLGALLAVLATMKVGDRMSLEIERKGKKIALTAHFGKN